MQTLFSLEVLAEARNLLRSNVKQFTDSQLQPR